MLGAMAAHRATPHIPDMPTRHLMLPACLSATNCRCAQAGEALESTESGERKTAEGEEARVRLAVRVGSLLGLVVVLSTSQLALRCPDWRNMVSVCLQPQGNSVGGINQQLCTGLIS